MTVSGCLHGQNFFSMAVYHHFPNPELDWTSFGLQIVALNKTKERMRPYHSHQEDEDPDIKKIKKVRSGRLLGAW